MLEFSLFWFGTTIFLLIVVAVLVFKLEDAEHQLALESWLKEQAQEESHAYAKKLIEVRKNYRIMQGEIAFYKNMKATEEINNGNNKD